MKALLDTHTFIWWDSEPGRLSAAAMALLKDPSTTVLLSVVSVWEIVLKEQQGRLSMRAALRDIVDEQVRNGIQILDVTLAHSLAVSSLPLIHKDPFDRLLVAQANVEGAVLVTADSLLSGYPVSIHW
jgi:PIN domain nuclease of toxin-antitoxin system